MMWNQWFLWLDRQLPSEKLNILTRYIKGQAFLKVWWENGYDLVQWINQSPHKQPDHQPLKCNEECRLRFDGGSIRNPGIAGSGWTVDIPDVDGTFKEYAWGYRYLSDNKSNNEAEYVALISGLQAVHFLGFRSVLIEGDSQLIIHQFQSLWRSRDKYCYHYKRIGRPIFQAFQEVKLNHIWREHNTRVDALSKLAMHTKT